MRTALRSASRHAIPCILLLVPGVAVASSHTLEQLLEMSLEALVDVRVSVASHFVEPQRLAGSTSSVVSEVQWRKRGARRLTDALGHLPGLIVLPNWFGAEQIMIRGYADGNNSGGIATLWDGVPVSSVEGSPQFNRQFINLGTLHRLEVIRGPGSALHGENAFHGVLAMHSFESATDQTRVDVEGASNEFWHASARHSTALGAGVRLHASAAHSGQRDQHREYEYFEPPGQSERAYEYRSSSAVFKLTSDPAHAFTWNAGLYYDDIDADGFLSSGTSGSGGLDGRDTGGVDSTLRMLRGGVGYRIDATTQLDASLYHWLYDRTYTRNTSLTRMLTGTGDATDSGARIVVKQRELFGSTQWAAAFDARIQDMTHAHRRIVDTTTGAVVIDEDLQFDGFERTIYSLSFDADTVFASGSLRLRYGARVDDYSDFGTQTTPRAAVIYAPTAQSALKLLYGEGFRAPNALEVKGSATIQGDPDIKPEQLASWELAYVVQTPHTLSEFTLFKSRWTNAIVTTPVSGDPVYTARYLNSGSSEAWGAEMSFALQDDPWTVETSASWVRSTNNMLDTEYGAFPRWILNLGAGYRLARYRTEIFVNARAHLDTEESQTTVTYTEPATLKDYWRADMHVATQLGARAVVRLDIRNLFDRQNYLPSIQTNPSPGGIPDEPRSIRLGLTWSL